MYCNVTIFFANGAIKYAILKLQVLSDWVQSRSKHLHSDLIEKEMERWIAIENLANLS